MVGRGDVEKMGGVTLRSRRWGWWDVELEELRGGGTCAWGEEWGEGGTWDVELGRWCSAGMWG